MAIVNSPTPVTLAGPVDTGTGLIETALTHAPCLVAADGGAARLARMGLDPMAVIGDLDSLPEDLQRRMPGALHRIDEQDTTDFDKALRSIRAPVVIAVGFSGGRLDHELAVLSSLIAHPDSPCIVLGPETLAFHCPPDLRLTLDPGDLVSLFPMAPVTVSMTGLRWSFDALDLCPGGRIGTSNEALGGAVTIAPSGSGLLVILRQARLPAAIAALTSG